MTPDDFAELLLQEHLATATVQAIMARVSPRRHSSRRSAAGRASALLRELFAASPGATPCTT